MPATENSGKAVHLQCFYCGDDYTTHTPHEFASKSICHYCQHEIDEYFKRLCLAKKEMRKK